jgi:hypothetical protein
MTMLSLATIAATAALGLAQPPYLGIACGGPNMTTCGRVGVAVWLVRPALHVSATLAGVPVRMHAGGLGGRGPTYWEGYVTFRPGRLGLPPRWYGSNPAKWLLLRLTISRADGTARGAVRSFLHAGWG